MNFERILVPLDGSPLSEESLPHALRMARAFGAELLLLRVLDVSPAVAEHGPESFDWRLRRLQALRYLEAHAERIAKRGLRVECRLAEGRPAERIVEFVREHDVDLVVLGAYGWGGVTEFPFGGTVHKVIANAGVSCAVIRPEDGSRADPEGGYQRILVPLDGSRRAEWAVALAASLLSSDHGELLLLQVISAPEMPRPRPLTREEIELRDKVVECNRRAANAYLDEIRGRFDSGPRVRALLVVAPGVVEAIGEVAEQESVDLIALAAHGAACASGLAQGSVGRALLAHGTRPVLVFQDSQASAALGAPLGEAIDMSARRAGASLQ